MLVTAAKLTQTDLLARAAQSKIPQLIVIPYSHYCELAVWALARRQQRVEIHNYAPGQHILPVLRNRVAGPGPNQQSTSSNIRDTLIRFSEKNGSSPPSKASRGAATAVPLLCMPDGRVLRDSWEIIAAAEDEEGAGQPTVIDAPMKQLLDLELAPLSRQLAYVGLLKPSNRNVWDGLVAPPHSSSSSSSTTGYSHSTGDDGSISISHSNSSGMLWRACWHGLGAGDALTGRMVKMFGVTDAAVADECRQRLRCVFATLAAELEARETDTKQSSSSSSSSSYSPSSSSSSSTSWPPSVFDVAVAALAAPVVMPPEFCGGAYRPLFDALLAQDPEVAAEADEWRATPVGQHTLRIYEKHRLSLTK
jgi:hypothetical protein